MMIYLLPILYAYLLWVLFLAVMALQNKWHDLPKTVKVLAIPAVLAAVTLDVLFNLTIGTVLFLDIPRQYTLSQRVGGYKQNNDWRRPIAVWICSNMLDPFQAGGHCKG